jgi:IclR family transcriptional regulator, KDG regulon repressor
MINTQVRADGTVGKALEVLDCVAKFGRPVRFSELLELSPYPKATLYRFLQTLTSQNMLAYNDDGTYWLGARLMRLAHAAWKNASLAPIARKHIEALAATVGESVHLAQLDNGHVLFVDKLKATQQFDTLAQVGQVAPAYCTGVGKAMLAFLSPKRLELALLQQSYHRYTDSTHTSRESLVTELEQVRKDGIAYDRQEHEHGIISIAAPILNTNGRVIGALSVATSTTRHTLEGLEEFHKPLLATAEKIGEEATQWQFPD